MIARSLLVMQDALKSKTMKVAVGVLPWAGIPPHAFYRAVSKTLGASNEAEWREMHRSGQRYAARRIFGFDGFLCSGMFRHDTCPLTMRDDTGERVGEVSVARLIYTPNRTF